METIQKTTEELGKELANDIINGHNETRGMIESFHTKGFNKLWSQSKEVIQASFDLLGENALQIFSKSFALQTFLKSVDAEYVFLVPPYLYEIVDGVIKLGDINPDGTIISNSIM